ncbi:MAG TPA: trehalose-phosphatase [Steroidobacteraceae bacterium]|nr:trehalose-phosphatase [Steroidobacteraceae bacterium]
MAATSHIDNPALSAIALFLDVDGTLLEIAARPQAVSVPAELRELLRGLSLATGGAVALVSGRAIRDLDALFDPLMLPSAGLHGFEHRGTSGEYRRRAAPSTAALEIARSAMQQLARQHGGLLLEDKQFALALHYRGAPQLEDTVVAAMQEVAARVRDEFELQCGKKVVELRPAGATKAKAVAAYLEEAPFAGRMPVFIGDDLTDEPAFELVNRLEGLSILVGDPRPSAARARLADVAAVRAWLADLRAQPAAALRRLSVAVPGDSGRGESSRQGPQGRRLRSQAR